MNVHVNEGSQLARHNNRNGYISIHTIILILWFRWIVNRTFGIISTSMFLLLDLCTGFAGCINIVQTLPFQSVYKTYFIV